MNIVSWVALWLHENSGCTGYIPFSILVSCGFALHLTA
jgi:hypothetical protein